MLKEVDESHPLVPPSLKCEEERPVDLGVFLMWSISSTADVQGRALRPGSTPGAPLYKNDKPELKVVKWRIMKT